MFSSAVLQLCFEWAISFAFCLAMGVFSATGGGIFRRRGAAITLCSLPSLKTSSDSSERATGLRRTAQSSPSVTTGIEVARDLRKAEESEWWRRDGLGPRGGLVCGEASGLKVLHACGSAGITGSGICRDSLLARREVEAALGCNFQPRGSGPVMTDVWTAGGEEQEPVEDKEEEEEEEYKKLWGRQNPVGGQE